MSFFEEAVEQYTRSTCVEPGKIRFARNLPLGALLVVPACNWMAPKVTEHRYGSSSKSSYDQWEVAGYLHGEVTELSAGGVTFGGVIEDRTQLTFKHDMHPHPVDFAFVVTDAIKAKLIEIADHIDGLDHILIWRLNGRWKDPQTEMVKEFAFLRFAAEGPNGKFVDTRDVVGRRRI